MKFDTNKIHNLSIDGESAKHVLKNKPEWDGAVYVREPLGEVLNTLLVNNPTWRFSMTRISGYLSETVNSQQVDIRHQDGEFLGYLKVEYMRGAYMTAVHSERIKNGRAATSDVKRALGIIKKAFVKSNVNERIDKAVNGAGAVISNAYSHFRYKLARPKQELEGSAFDMVMSEREQEFGEYLSRVGRGELLSEYRELQMEMSTVEQVKIAFEGKRTALVIPDDNKYIVKIGDDVQLYTADTLPEQLRGRLGLLKLVNENQMVTNAGCRVSDTVFVVLIDNEELT
jgi:hypothetical protein